MTSSLLFIASPNWFVPSADEEMYLRIFSSMSCHSVFVANGELGFRFFSDVSAKGVANYFSIDICFSSRGIFGSLLVKHGKTCITKHPPFNV